MLSRPNSNELNLATEIRQALKEMHRESVEGDSWQNMALFRATWQNGTSRSDRQVINQILFDSIEQMESENRIYATVLRLRFLDKLPIHRVANELNLAESTIYAHQHAAIDSLAEKIAMRERAMQAALRTRVAQRLPLFTYHQLVGVEKILARLLDLVKSPAPPWIISIEGIGGIGKTSLAHALLRQVMDLGLVEEVAWVTAKDVRLTLSGEFQSASTPTLTVQGLLHHLATILMPELLAAGNATPSQVQELLHARLQETPHLIVVDNLETVVDLETLFPILQKLANPTKFILTTREGLYGEPNVFPLPMEELERAYALQLVRQEARLSNLSEVSSAAESELQRIYDTVGGNPLALRLVVGLLHVYDLPAIVQDLREAHGQAVENLYTFIYQRAWEKLDEVVRRVLLNMVLLRPNGDTLEFLEEISELPAYEVRTSIQKLVMLNLVEVRGDMNRRLYAIHGLTRTFLLKQVAKWM